MHRRMPKKVFMAAMVLAAALPSVTAGCAGQTKGQEEELVCLTDEVSEEVLQEEEKRDSQEDSAYLDTNDMNGTKDGNGTESMNGTADTKDGTAGNLREDPETAANRGIIYVHVCGQVACPGVYPLSAGSRICEAIEAAGGLLESGAGEWLNQAAQVEDGQQVYVPSDEEVRQAQQGSAEGGPYIAQQGITGSRQPSGQAAPPDDGKVDLNTASKEQLMTLSGIGEAKAASIIAYREEHGGFQKIEELMEVQGIKEGVFNKVRNQIRVD